MEEGKGPLIERYWKPPLPGIDGVSPLDLSLDDAASEVVGRLRTAVQRRLVSDVPLGAFLSGGVDSSAVVALMAESSARPVHTFTIGFEDHDGFDERPYARLVAERFGTEHVEFVVKPDAVDLVERLVWHHDQPFGDSSAMPTFLLSELTRRHVTVALCGDGGDEIFAGYERFAAALALDRFQRLPPALRTGAATAASLVPAGAVGGRGASLQRFMARSDLPLLDAYLGWVNVVPLQWRHALLGEPSDSATAGYREQWLGSEGCDLLDRLLQLNLDTYLLDDLLPKVDRMSMAHALEVRAPFLDRELVEFALRLPRAARLRGMNGKRALKRAFRGLLPREVLHRRKHGFGVPLDRWFRTGLRPYLEATLGAPDARTRQHLDGDALDRMLSEHQSGAANHRDSLWALLTLEVFLRRQGW
jgi:asparagine synthase (glutamine-hydrolysing)